MDELDLSYGDKKKLLKVISDQNQWHSLLGHLLIDSVPYRHSKRRINLAPFLENPEEYLSQLSPKCLLAKCLSDVKKIHNLYLLTDGAKTTVDGFLKAMEYSCDGGNSRFSQPFRFYSAAICNFIDIRRPISRRLDGLQHYSKAKGQLARFTLLSHLGKKLEFARKFTKRPIVERKDYIRELINQNPNIPYKVLWFDADKGIIGEMKLRRFENICSELASANKKRI